MAMTKAEKAALGAAETRAALRWTALKYPLAPDVHAAPGGTGSSIVYGWDINTYNGVVFKAWSDCNCHGNGWPTVRPGGGFSRDGGSQNKRGLYSSKLLALTALRQHLEQKAADQLRAIDRQLERAEAEPVEVPPTKGV